MKKTKSILAILIGFFLSLPVFAQSSDIAWVNEIQSMDSSQITMLVVLAVVLGVIVLLLILMIYLMMFMSTVLKRQSPEQVLEPSWWENFKEKFVTGKYKPVEEEEDLVLSHAHDGIVELDNHMPPWLKYLFYVSIAFGIVYVVNYSVLGIGRTQIEEYEEENRVAAIQAEAWQAMNVASIDENTVQFDKSGPSITAGQSIYENNCAACHASDGGGGIGPNFTDEYWIHGGSINDIFSVVKYGVIEKGMVPWQDILSPEEMQQVSSYILTLQGATPANPKEPQGERFEPGLVEPLDVLSGEELGLEPVEDQLDSIE